jgi:hypothetical protein
MLLRRRARRPGRSCRWGCSAVLPKGRPRGSARSPARLPTARARLPPGLMGHPFFFDMAHARLEFEVTCFGAIEQLLARTGVSPKQISGVVVNSSLFNPTPSLSAMIMNRFQMPSTTINYNLGGMGCSGAYVGPGGVQGLRCGQPGLGWSPQQASALLQLAASPRAPPPPRPPPPLPQPR